MARKGKYNDSMPLLAQEAARSGLSEKQVARNLGISVATLNVWKNTKSEFLEALRAGQKPVDIAVENALLKRALGSEYEDSYYEYDEKLVKGKVVRLKRGKKVVRHLPGDVNAMKFWLVNRQKGKWQDKVVTEHDGNITVIIDAKDAKL